MNRQTTTAGGFLSHYLRRTVHIAIFIIPLIYYAYGSMLANWLALSARELLLVILALALVLEIIRLHFGLLLFGQRDYERKQISGWTWGIIAIIFVLLFAPDKRFAIPIIWSCAFADPLLGELRRYQVNEILIWIAGSIFIAVIWLLCYWWFATPWWWAMIMGPLIVASEKPKLKWIDDNALMQLIPLIIVNFFYFFETFLR